MPDPIVPLEAIQRSAHAAAAAGQCPHTACPWPPGSAAAQTFHQQFHAEQAQQSAARGRQEVPYVRH